MNKGFSGCLPELKGRGPCNAELKGRGYWSAKGLVSAELRGWARYWWDRCTCGGCGVLLVTLLVPLHGPVIAEHHLP